MLLLFLLLLLLPLLLCSSCVCIRLIWKLFVRAFCHANNTRQDTRDQSLLAAKNAFCFCFFFSFRFSFCFSPSLRTKLNEIDPFVARSRSKSKSKSRWDKKVSLFVFASERTLLLCSLKWNKLATCCSSCTHTNSQSTATERICAKLVDWRKLFNFIALTWAPITRTQAAAASAAQ